jgi:hypothetical protein
LEAYTNSLTHYQNIIDCFETAPKILVIHN